MRWRCRPFWRPPGRLWWQWRQNITPQCPPGCVVHCRSVRRIVPSSRSFRRGTGLPVSACGHPPSHVVPGSPSCSRCTCDLPSTAADGSRGCLHSWPCPASWSTAEADLPSLRLPLRRSDIYSRRGRGSGWAGGGHHLHHQVLWGVHRPTSRPLRLHGLHQTAVPPFRHHPVAGEFRSLAAPPPYFRPLSGRRHLIINVIFFFFFFFLYCIALDCIVQCIEYVF